jgi:hypothetical protein
MNHAEPEDDGWTERVESARSRVCHAVIVLDFLPSQASIVMNDRLFMASLRYRLAQLVSHVYEQAKTVS